MDFKKFPPSIWQHFGRGGISFDSGLRSEVIFLRWGGAGLLVFLVGRVRCPQRLEVREILPAVFVNFFCVAIVNTFKEILSILLPPPVYGRGYQQ